MKKKRLDKRGISPVIATVLLIAMVVVIALIIFLWFRQMTQEAITKFDGENVELVCGKVEFDASYSLGTLYVTNNANVPIYRMKIKKGGASRSTTTIETSDGWPGNGLNQGGAFSGAIDVGGASEITLIPVLLGESESGKKTYTCKADQHGYEISVN